MKKILALPLMGILCLCIASSGLFALGETVSTETPAASETAAVEETPAPSVSENNEVFEDPQALTGEADTQAEAADAETATYVATANAPLKVRRAPDKTASGNGSIAKGDMVYILELGNEWSKVDTGRNTGYVQTKYLTDIHEYGTSQTASATASPSATAEPTGEFLTDGVYDAALFTPEGFKDNFNAEMYKSAAVRKTMDDRSAAVFHLDKYDEVVVSAYQGDWSYIRYQNSYGFVPTSSLFKWDRIDPYAGDIPGCIKHIGLAFVNHSTDIKSYDDNGKKVLKTVNPGSALAVDTKDAEGRYPLPYWRTTGYIEESDISYILPVVPWEDAQSGDMISCMSTYYAVGIHSLQYQGRNYNIYLGSSFISGTVMQPGETLNIYDVMGPYRKSTGYHRAPVMSPNALWGYGGGTCQVNTTLYNALIQVPIYINWRRVHADVGIYYCPVGFDAAVGGGNITMIFTNTLPYAVRFNYFMSDGCLTVGIFKV
ncbi:MAG TPA: VanW family protein [Candidatus Limiplasma sp.]|nr:VanW family protein [Candidatus Limiplasma sp.]HPS81009.1 VanW family protein [Candidatus Limiplasma sp.]